MSCVTLRRFEAPTIGMISVRNAGGAAAAKVDVRFLRATLAAALEAAGYAGWDVGCRNVSLAAMTALNKRYRGKDAPTDILSFANYRLPRPEAFPPPDALDLGRDLGDLVVCADYVAAVLARGNVTVTHPQQHWRVLMVHGVVHLLGYDHETETDHAAMAAREAALLARLPPLPPQQLR